MNRCTATLALLAGAAWVVTTGCTFNFALTSQRTALENQVMGSYRELEDELVLVSSVRGPVDPSSSDKTLSLSERAARAHLNQDFNRDDLDELKAQQIVGETKDGRLVLLPQSLGKQTEASASQLQLARELLEQENRDRQIIWQHIIATNENLKANDLPQVQRTYAKMQREAADPGFWVETEQGQWTRKPSSTQTDSDG